MREKIPVTVEVEAEKIYCDICGEKTKETYSLSVTVNRDCKVVAEYGLNFTHTGDWCESCRDKLDFLLERALSKVLAERYTIDHSGENGTIEFYKKVLSKK